MTIRQTKNKKTKQNKTKNDKDNTYLRDCSHPAWLSKTRYEAKTLRARGHCFCWSAVGKTQAWRDGCGQRGHWEIPGTLQRLREIRVVLILCSNRFFPTVHGVRQRRQKSHELIWFNREKIAWTLLWSESHYDIAIIIIIIIIIIIVTVSVFVVNIIVDSTPCSKHSEYFRVFPESSSQNKFELAIRRS